MTSVTCVSKSDTSPALGNTVLSQAESFLPCSSWKQQETVSVTSVTSVLLVSPVLLVLPNVTWKQQETVRLSRSCSWSCSCRAEVRARDNIRENECRQTSGALVAALTSLTTSLDTGWPLAAWAVTW